MYFYVLQVFAYFFLGFCFLSLGTSGRFDFQILYVYLICAFKNLYIILKENVYFAHFIFQFRFYDIYYGV